MSNLVEKVIIKSLPNSVVYSHIVTLDYRGWEYHLSVPYANTCFFGSKRLREVNGSRTEVSSGRYRNVNKPSKVILQAIKGLNLS